MGVRFFLPRGKVGLLLPNPNRTQIANQYSKTYALPDLVNLLEVLAVPGAGGLLLVTAAAAGGPRATATRLLFLMRRRTETHRT